MSDTGRDAGREAGREAGTASFADQTLREFVTALASAAPVPGGGAASALTGALGAALVSMVAELSDENRASAAHRHTQVAVRAEARALADRLLELADADAAAFAGFGAAMKLPRATEEEKAVRSAAIRAAARAAAEPPLQATAAAAEVARLAETLAGRSNPNLASDLVVASHFAEAAAAGAAANVRVNLPLVNDAALEASTVIVLDTLLAETESLASAAREVIGSGTARHVLSPVGEDERDSAAPGLSVQTAEVAR